MTQPPDLGVNIADLIDPQWRGRRVAVAMSGGVDSSVAAIACLLAGCEVVGITMKLWDFADVGGDRKQDGRCCTVESFDACRAIAAQHGFPHYAIDLQKRFETCVIGNFVSEYRKGRTPNPCTVCNIDIKWGAFWEKARAFGCDALATGHYALLESGPDGTVALRRGVDRSRDQTYFLWGIAPDLLERTLFPLGGLTKDRVREIARRLGLVSAETPESRDICFVDDGDLSRFLTEQAQRQGMPPSAGPIVDRDGTEIGRHEGIESFTVGQRRGLGVARGRPQYVTAIDPEARTVTIGDDGELFNRRFRVDTLNWLAAAPAEPLQVLAQIRYSHTAAPALLSPQGSDSVLVEFDDPQRAITPGQSAVFYDGDRVLAGGIIDSVERP